MKTLFTPFLLLAVAIITFTSCGEDNIISTDELEGRWEITEAYRDGESTTTMEGMYYVFAPDGQLRNNMMGAEETYAYELDGDQLTQRDGSLDADYTIELHEAGEMVLTTKLRGKSFRMILQKQ